ncbi:TRAP transporter small permease [Parasalinivibrio latis]|uniref:TRAP transporter small permease n=1 Tax=Parasalinivibrio latis TaxID=2952610 RepID=UPI0030E0C4B5
MTNKLYTWVGQAEVLLSSLAMCVVLFSVLWGVLTRYITEQPAVWTTELSGIAFTWMVFLGASVCFRRGLHIGVPVIVELFPVRYQKVLHKITTLIILAFIAYTFYLAVIMAWQSWNRPSPVLRLPFTFVYGATCLAFLFMFIHGTRQLFVSPYAPGVSDAIHNKEVL